MKKRVEDLKIESVSSGKKVNDSFYKTIVDMIIKLEQKENERTI